MTQVGYTGAGLGGRGVGGGGRYVRVCFPQKCSAEAPFTSGHVTGAPRGRFAGGMNPIGKKIEREL